MRSDDVKEGYVLKIKEDKKIWYKKPERIIYVTKENNTFYGIKVPYENYAIPFSDLEPHPLMEYEGFKLLARL